MPDLGAYFRTAPVSKFSGTVYRICPARYGAITSAATSERCTSRFPKKLPVARWRGISQRRRGTGLWRLLRKAGIAWEQLIGAHYTITQEIGLRAWESGVEALLAPSAAYPAERNLAVFLDNQRPLWEVALTNTSATND